MAGWADRGEVTTWSAAGDVRGRCLSLRDVTSLDRKSLQASPYDLSADDIDELLQFATDCSRLIGAGLKQVSLEGDPQAPVVTVVFTDHSQRPGVVYSYEWQLRDLEDPDDLINPLGVMLVDNLGNHILEDLQTTLGLPIWEPDHDGMVHVNVTSEAYRSWPVEWRKLGRPWRDQEGRLRYADR